MKVVEVVGLESPLDLRIARQRASPGARNVGQHAIEATLQGELQGVSSDDLNVSSADTPLQQFGTVVMKLDGDDCRVGISRCDGCGLATWRGAAIQNACAFADERGDQLRSFVLNENATFAVSLGLRDVAAGNDAG